MAPSLDIIVVENCDALREELVTFLQRPDWYVRGVDCGEALDTALRTRPAHIVVVDLDLPFEDGFSIARRLRDAMPNVGIVMLTAHTRPSDRANGYAAGADAFLTKPTNVGELEAVVQNLGRRVIPQAHEWLTLNMRMLTISTSTGLHLQLTLNETRILNYLAAASERQADNDFLIRMLSQNDSLHFSRGNLTVLISNLRSKMDKVLQQHDIIKAVRGYGYKLTVLVVIEESDLRNALMDMPKMPPKNHDSPTAALTPTPARGTQ